MGLPYGKGAEMVYVTAEVDTERGGMRVKATWERGDLSRRPDMLPKYANRLAYPLAKASHPITTSVEQAVAGLRAHPPSYIVLEAREREAEAQRAAVRALADWLEPVLRQAMPAPVPGLALTRASPSQRSRR